MFIIKFDNAGAEQGIKQVERKYRILLPEMYKRFLERYNGGYTPQTTFRVKLPDFRIAIHSDLVGFYGVAKAELNFSIIDNTPFIKQLLNIFHCFPIGVNTKGDFIVIGVGKDNSGQIFIIERAKANRVVPVANNLATFSALCKSKKSKQLDIAKKQEELILQVEQ